MWLAAAFAARFEQMRGAFGRIFPGSPAAGRAFGAIYPAFMKF